MKWPQATLSDLGTISTGSTPRTDEARFYGGEVPFITPRELDQVEAISVASRTLTDEGARIAGLLPANAIMVCCIGSLGKIGMAGRPVATNQQINSVTFDESKIWPRYGYYACRRLRQKLEVMAPATTLPIVNKSKFSALSIPVPPLPEQRRIAEVLDRAEALRAKRRAALAKLDTLTQAIFLDMFGDPATNPKGWPRHSLGEVAQKITDGEHLNPVFSPSGMPIVMAGNVLDDSIDFDNAKAVEWELGVRFRKKCDPELGDLLLVSRGATIGRQCVVSTTRKLCLMGSVILIKPHREEVDSWFLSTFLKHPVSQSALYKTSGSSAQQAIYLKDLRNLNCVLPPIDLQHDFARRAAQVEKLKATHQTSLAKLDALFASLQHRAFRGEL
jgi:type I restriction enzyme S subunit